MSAALGCQTSSGLPLASSDEHRNCLISLGNVEGHGSELQYFNIVISYCHMQPEKG